MTPFTWLYSAIRALADALLSWFTQRASTPTTVEDSRPDTELDERLRHAIDNARQPPPQRKSASPDDASEHGVQ